MIEPLAPASSSNWQTILNDDGDSLVVVSLCDHITGRSTFTLSGSKLVSCHIGVTLSRLITVLIISDG